MRPPGRAGGRVADTRFGLLPDFGNINPGDDRAAVIRRIAPWAKGVSVKAAWDEQKKPWDIVLMVHICQDAAYRGWWGIESSFGAFGMNRQSDPGLSNQQIWGSDVKGVRLTSELIKRHFHGRIE